MNKKQKAYDVPLMEVRKTSISGRGVFAQSYINAGTYVAPLTGIKRHRHEVDWETFEGLIMQIDDNLFLEEAGGVDDFFNHSCEPNIAFTLDGTGFYALRDINFGEEIALDYSTCEDDPDWRVPCLCGTPSCRGVIQGFSGLTPKHQQRLLPICLPYLRRRFK